MDICFVTTGDLKSLATGKRATGMAGPLMELGHEVSIIIQDTATNRERLALECPDATALYFPGGSTLSEMSRKRALLREARPDVVYVCAFGARNFVVSRCGLRCPLYFVEHSELRSSFRSELGPIRANRERLLEYYSMLAADGLVCASRYLERKYGQRLQRAHLRRPILYSPYAYNESVMAPRPGEGEELRARFAGRRVLVYMGSFVENYGLFELLDSMALLQTRQPDILLLLIGRGPDEERARQYLTDHGLSGSVQIEGYVSEEDLPRYFGLAAAFVSPLQDKIQDWARCPSKLYMYLPFERPIVTCRIGEAAELFGEGGFYYQPGNTQELADRIVEATSSPGSWRPRYDHRRHSWATRAREFTAWVEANWDIGRRRKITSRD